MEDDFIEFAKVGRKFNISGLPEVYKIIEVDTDKVVVTIEGIGSDFNVEIGDAEDSFKVGMWRSIVTLVAAHRDGMDCCKCNNFFQFAAPNQDDGTMICWSCRSGF
ncbi:hypothetical protein LCGC14_0533340 [marine sediment metagenome]|uniref:Uncharacterized protein n=1 Tax=marine sediment metagenome TaxID=412755 RepID=A0A0F9RZN7_9ZZZZ